MLLCRLCIPLEAAGSWIWKLMKQSCNRLTTGSENAHTRGGQLLLCMWVHVAVNPHRCLTEQVCCMLHCRHTLVPYGATPQAMNWARPFAAQLNISLLAEDPSWMSTFGTKVV